MSDAAVAAVAPRPGLLYFHSSTSGACRRIEGYIAQVLQRRRNHDTFRYYSVADVQRPDLLERFGIKQIPTLVVVEHRTIRARLEGAHGCKEIERFLAPWLH